MSRSLARAEQDELDIDAFLASFLTSEPELATALADSRILNDALDQLEMAGYVSLDWARNSVLIERARLLEDVAEKA